MCPAFVPLSSYLPRLLYQSISTKLYFIFTPMSNQRNTKRKRATGPMIVGEVDSAQVVTPKTIYKTKKDGTVMSTQIWESLDPPVRMDLTTACASTTPCLFVLIRFLLCRFPFLFCPVCSCLRGWR